MKKDCEEQSFFRKEMYLIKYWMKTMLVLHLMMRHFARVDFYNQDTIKKI